MIARMWHAFAPKSSADEHKAHIQRTLLPTYLNLPGSRGALLLTRSQIDCTESLVLSMWDSVALETLIGSRQFEEASMNLEMLPGFLHPGPVVKHYEVLSFKWAQTVENSE